MIVQFRSGFEKDLFLAHDKKLAQTILDCIQLFENAERLIEIPNIKKIKGHQTAFRYRKGKYRIGIYYDHGIVTFAAFAPRDKIYTRFP